METQKKSALLRSDPLLKKVAYGCCLILGR